MSDNEENKLPKIWKDHFLRSGVPLEYEIAKLLTLEGMSVDADFSFSRNDIVGTKEWSVDLGATSYGPSPNKLNYELDALIECKYRAPGKVFLFLEEPSKNYSPVTLGGTTASFDQFVPHILP
jgi:hypothetical protein